LFSAHWPRPELRRPFQIAFYVTMAGVAAALLLGVVGGPAAGGTATVEPADPSAPLGGASVALMGPERLAAVAAVVAALAFLAGVYFALRSFGRDIRRFAAFDLLMVFGLFVLPQLTAFPVLALGRNPLNYTLPPTTGMGFGQALATFIGSDAGVTLGVCVGLIIVTLVMGYFWDWRRFLICAAIFYGIFITLFTTFFTNGGGLASGLIGSLAYWLEQHPVQRGSQPWYYYLVINIPFYEFLPAIGALYAGYLGLRKWLRVGEDEDEAAAEANGARPLSFPVIGFFGFWSVMSLAAFSIAGEKMPWLTTHITLPLILVAGWAIGGLIERTNWRLFAERRAWLVALLMPVTIVALAALLGSLGGASPPFQGSTLAQLQATGVFVSALIVAGIGLTALYGLGQQLGFGNVGRLAGLSFYGLLALLTARTGFIAAFVNYDYANEYLVYAHGSRGVRTVMDQVEDLSRRIEDGLGLKVAYDSDVAWPMTWYFRNFTTQAYYGDNPTREQLDAPVVISGPKHWSRVEAILGNRYYSFEYIRMVWPMQEYWNLNWERIRYAATSAEYRQAIWEIWFARDYTRYGRLTNRDYSLSEWPVAERMRLYVRKDVAAQIWSYGVGPTVLEGDAAIEDPYVGARQDRSAALSIGGQGTGPGRFEGPRDVAVGPDGSIYVADTRNHRIQKFDASGNFVLAWGSQGGGAGAVGPGQFNEPWGLAVGPDGSVYVADTWNHRVQKFNADGGFLTAWGYFGQAEAPEAFWGPRDVAVDALGRVYVADTGNKRVAVFDANGLSVTSIGFGGSDRGQFDEPVGLATTSDGLLFVADTWNQRVQVFRWEPLDEEYAFVRDWPIVGWYGQSLDNKPYLATDGRDRVYVSDPEGFRVLVFDAAGNFLTTWGDYGLETNRFGLLNGLAADAAGNVYAADAGNNRVLVFPALP
jgi:uncharacterized protein (TIGR03663 family)